MLVHRPFAELDRDSDTNVVEYYRFLLHFLAMNGALQVQEI